MPSFVNTKSKEKKWAKAKKAADKSHSESEGDSYWKIVNSIYQKIVKSTDLALELGDEEALSKVITMLQKADDEFDDSNDLGEGYSEIDPDAEESAGDDWLKENDPKEGEDYEEYGDDEDEDAHRKNIEDDENAEEVTPSDLDEGEEAGAESGSNGPAAPQLSEKELAGLPKNVRDIYAKAQSKGSAPQKVEASAGAPQEVKRSTRFKQPTPEEIQAMRPYARQWEQRARETNKLRADPSKNPVLAQQGQIVEAREKAHGGRKSAYQQLINSGEYKNADPMQQMEMDDNFERDWKQKNPDALKTAFAGHHAANEKGRQAKAQHAAAKDADIRNIIRGGSQSGGNMSTEAALQNVGGVKGEEGTTGRIMQDPAASFANNNQDFIKDFAEKYNKKGAEAPEAEEDYNDVPEKDISSILGKGPAKDPKVEAFFSHYYPLIGMSKAKVLKKLGLDAKGGEVDHEGLDTAGTHGLFQAINDYDHNHPSKASFATHAGNKIRGLMQTHLREQDKIPVEMRRAQAQHAKKNAPPVKTIMSGGQAAAPAESKPAMPPPRPTKSILATHSKAPEVKNRLGHTSAARASVIRRKPPGEQGNE